MIKILVVEDSTTVTKILRHLLRQQPDIHAYYATSRAECMQLYETHKDSLFAAIVDLNLPDAPNGETVDELLAHKLPVIVLTANYQEERREALLNKGIVDYVLKEGRYSYQRAINLLHRLEKNQHIKILVAEDSRPAQQFIKGLLNVHRYQVLEAENGIEALKQLAQHPDISLLITDYHMPEMDGFELVRSIRQNTDKSDLVIIGLSGEGRGAVSAKFIKNGANDFLIKPFYHEEFYCRITHCIEEKELIQQIRDVASRDDLTGLYNRRYVFERGTVLHQQAASNGTPMAVALITIDHFKTINDNYGHAAGDTVLSFAAQELKDAFSRFTLARTGGEKFALIMPGLNNEQAYTLIDKFRALFSTHSIDVGDESLHLTLSGGISNQLGASFDEQLKGCEALLRRAREAGKNIVMADDEDT